MVKYISAVSEHTSSVMSGYIIKMHNLQERMYLITPSMSNIGELPPEWAFLLQLTPAELDNILYSKS